MPCKSLITIEKKTMCLIPLKLDIFWFQFISWHIAFYFQYSQLKMWLCYRYEHTDCRSKISGPILLWACVVCIHYAVRWFLIDVCIYSYSTASKTAVECVSVNTQSVHFEPRFEIDPFHEWNTRLMHWKSKSRPADAHLGSWYHPNTWKWHTIHNTVRQPFFLISHFRNSKSMW